jgi:hypothetical protein
MTISIKSVAQKINFKLILAIVFCIGGGIWCLIPAYNIAGAMIGNQEIIGQIDSRLSIRMTTSYTFSYQQAGKTVVQNISALIPGEHKKKDKVVIVANDSLGVAYIKDIALPNFLYNAGLSIALFAIAIISTIQQLILPNIRRRTSQRKVGAL